jgi:hypothetical protein
MAATGDVDIGRLRMGIPTGSGIGLSHDGSPPIYAHRLVIRSPPRRSTEKPEMTRYERKLFFERLLAIRDAYRAEAHESTDMTIELAMIAAEHAFNAAAAADADATIALTDGATTPD